MFEDTYFLDQKKAIEVAKQQNRPSATTLQACYYNGDKLDIDLPNLIHLPFDNLIEGLAQGIHRIPTKIDLSGLNLSAEVKHEIFKNFNIAIVKAQALRDEYNKAYIESFKNYKPNFKETPWRFYLPTYSSTQVMQHVSKSIADTLNDMGYSVIYDLKYGTEDVNCIKTLFLSRPHAKIELNDFSSRYLPS